MTKAKIKQIKDKVFTYTKVIVTWAMVVTTLYLAMSEYGIYVLDKQPSEMITDLVQYLIVGVIIGYMGKSGFEFYQNKRNEIATLNIYDDSNSTNNTENEGEIK